MGHLGLDPGILGFKPERTEVSVVVRVAWSGDYACPPTSSRICFPGYMIGYIASGVESPALSRSLVPMDSKLRSALRGQFSEMATTKAARKTCLKGSLGGLRAAARMRVSAVSAALGPRRAGGNRSMRRHLRLLS